MKGLELAKLYYEQYGKDMIRFHFPEYERRIAVGLVGQGSECFGFDDEISQDHDFGPAFCMWLTDEDDSAIGADLQKSYQSLPADLLGIPARREGPMSGGRIGVIRIKDFYRQQIGRPDAEIPLKEWVYLPESRLATVTNGEVFYDPLGEFTSIRQRLLKFYPEDVRLKKIAARLATMAQSGQYNYARSLCRGEFVSASQSMAEFVRSAISIVFLLNRRYTPFYKWSHRAMSSLHVLPQVRTLLDELVREPIRPERWVSQDRRRRFLTINREDRQIAIVEEICGLVKDQLKLEGLTSGSDDFLESHAHQVMSKIQDSTIRAMHVLEG